MTKTFVIDLSAFNRETVEKLSKLIGDAHDKELLEALDEKDSAVAMSKGQKVGRMSEALYHVDNYIANLDLAELKTKAKSDVKASRIEG